MRILIASATSGLTHALVLGGLAAWTVDSWSLNYRVAAGHAITVRFSPAAAVEEKQRPVAIELSPDPPRPTELPDPVERVELQQQLAVVEIAEVLVRVKAPESEIVLDRPPPPAKEMEDQPDTPEEEKPLPLARRPTAEPPGHEVAAIPLEFEATVIAGASDPDVFPQKWPLNPAPPYPTDALLAGIEGRVVLRVRVASDGTVEEATIAASSGSPSLDNSAAATVRRWRFEPARKRGIPMAFDVFVPVTFHIRRRLQPQRLLDRDIFTRRPRARR